MNVQDSNEESIFHQALEWRKEEERQTYLQTACGSNLALKHSIEALLKAHENVGQEKHFLEPHEEQGRRIDKQDPSFTPLDAPQSIDRYRLIKLIGAGGFGEVYLAEQTEPVSRHVALKILKQGSDDLQVKARFDAERQALANMDHPNIAKVLDGGDTADGRPYFVMDYIDGESITAYQARKHLGVVEILELFATICQAMQHAHDNGVIHRDLKPSNILITRKDGLDVVKLIDFGIAKAKIEPWGLRSAQTNQHQLLGTPAYMSAEQARCETVDHRTDIWSIAVVLFECLAGKNAFQGNSSMEILGAIMHQDPDWDALPAGLPENLRRLLEDCLQ